jgi:hypothetical protein
MEFSSMNRCWITKERSENLVASIWVSHQHYLRKNENEGPMNQWEQLGRLVGFDW